MSPELFRLPEALGGLPVPAYGLFLLLGALAGSLLFAWLALRAGAPGGKAFEVSLEVIVVGLVAARAAGVALLPQGTPRTAEVVAGSGGVWYFGFLAGFAWFSWRRRALGLAWLDALDRMAPASALGHAIGRVGCFLAGCCFGRRCDLPWAVTFPAHAAGPGTGVPAGIPLHPTQLYEAGVEALACAVMVFWLLRRPACAGLVSLGYLASYAAARLVIEDFRADHRGSLGSLSTSQLVALAILAVTVPALLVTWRRGGLGSLSEPPPAVPTQRPRRRTRAARPRAKR